MAVLINIGGSTPGIPLHELDLCQLFDASSDREAFEVRWVEFISSMPTVERVFEREHNKLRYRSESFLPVGDDRPAVALVLGNPATQSVASGVCFAYEGPARREHRVWGALRDAGILTLPVAEVGLSVEAVNRSRAECLLHASYLGPCRIGIEVMFTFPTPASAPKWAGVAGVRRLFGQRAFARLWQAEQVRLISALSSYLGTGGSVAAFQKEAYEGLRQPSDPPYSLDLARSLQLVARLRDHSDTPLLGLPPTRFAHSVAFKEGLRAVRSIIGGSAGLG